ncbi:hypothetical protein BDQ12DRAFT_680632 [Crucibulum laeve]|uniref:Uncharacterized protein n=1 Tax=Crucibulum laeve TaxID=68775 RepID=A0A5C3M5S4_9AGAR|nr:hypothetical protein BDQ12DRAFT_680632 [Crucibulum laeve]
MHRLNIFLFCHGHSGWADLFFCSSKILTLTLGHQNRILSFDSIQRVLLLKSN